MSVVKLVFAVLLLLSPSALADTVRVAVAANFRAPLLVLQRTFEAETQHRLSISAGATGQLFAQVIHGAPFDIFLSADQARPAALVENGSAVTGSQFTYATGRLYLLFDSNKRLDGTQWLAHRVPDLTGIRRISIANPRTAPYGMAAEQVLRQLDFSDAPPLVAQAQSVSGVNAAFAARAVDAGFAAYSSVVMLAEPPAGWLVPDNMHDPIRQDAVLLTRAEDNPAAVAFLDWLQNK